MTAKGGVVFSALISNASLSTSSSLPGVGKSRVIWRRVWLSWRPRGTCQWIIPVVVDSSFPWLVTWIPSQVTHRLPTKTGHGTHGHNSQERSQAFDCLLGRLSAQGSGAQSSHGTQTVHPFWKRPPDVLPRSQYPCFLSRISGAGKREQANCTLSSDSLVSPAEAVLLVQRISFQLYFHQRDGLYVCFFFFKKKPHNNSGLPVVIPRAALFLWGFCQDSKRVHNWL